jgi:hypothetical protein
VGGAEEGRGVGIQGGGATSNAYCSQTACSRRAWKVCHAREIIRVQSEGLKVSCTGPVLLLSDTLARSCNINPGPGPGGWRLAA